MKTYTIMIKSILDAKNFVNIVNACDFDIDLESGRYLVDEIYAEDMQVLTRPQNQDGQQPTQNQQQYGTNQYTTPAAQTFTQPTAPAQQPVQQPVADPVAQPFIGAPSGMDEDLPF